MKMRYKLAGLAALFAAHNLMPPAIPQDKDGNPLPMQQVYTGCKLKDIYKGRSDIPQLSEGSADFVCNGQQLPRFYFKPGTYQKFAAESGDTRKATKTEQMSVVRSFDYGVTYELAIDRSQGTHQIAAYRTLKISPYSVAARYKDRKAQPKAKPEFWITISDCGVYELKYNRTLPPEHRYEASCTQQKIAELVAAAKEAERKTAIAAASEGPATGQTPVSVMRVGLFATMPRPEKKSTTIAHTPPRDKIITKTKPVKLKLAGVGGGWGNVVITTPKAEPETRQAAPKNRPNWRTQLFFGPQATP